MLMKKSNIALLTCLAVVGIAGAATASAFLINDASTTISGNADSAIVLEWGETSSLDDIDALSPNSPAYRSISVAAPVSTSSVANGGALTATLSVTDVSQQDDTTPSIYGLMVEIATVDWQSSEEVTADLTLDATTDQETTSYTDSITGITEETTYYIKVSIDNDIYLDYYYDGDATLTLAGTLTFSYGLSA